MKGIILHGGAGTRLRPLTYSGPKQLIPVANKPVSQYALEDLINAGVKDIAIVLGNTFPELVREHYGDGSKFNARITYVKQGDPLGIAHAVKLCRDFVRDEKFVVYLGDNILQGGIKSYAEEFNRENYDAMVLLKEVDDPKRFGVAQFDGKKLVRVVEKPKVPPSNYAVIGIYFFTPVVFKAIDELKPSWRGEYEITDAIQKLIDWGLNVEYKIVDGWWVDTGKKDDILAVNALILDERAKRDVRGEIINSKIEGRVEIGEKTRVLGSVIRGPCVIGRNCTIEGSYIGPYTSIGDGTQIYNSSIEYCVVMDNVVIRDVERMEESLIGRNAKVIKSEGNRKSLRLHVGDYSEILL